MESVIFPTTAEELATRFGAQLIGSPSATITRVSELAVAGEGCLSFVSNKKFEALLPKLSGAVLFTRENYVHPELPLTYLVVTDPQRAFSSVARVFLRKSEKREISPLASIHPSARIAEDVFIGSYAVIGPNVEIGSGTSIFSHAFIGRDVKIGKNCAIYPHSTLWDGIFVGNRVTIFAGASIGLDGFGLLPPDAKCELFTEIPQLGTVIIEDDVRIGSHCTIDRAALGATRIGKGSKLDSHVHIGHNCKLGKNVVLCAQVGLAGSCTLGDNVVFAGQVGLADGVNVGDRVRMGGQAGASTDLDAGEDYFMTPAIPLKESYRVVRYLRKLPEIWQRLKALETRLNEKGNK